MIDGHSGISNAQVNEATAGAMQFRLSLLKQPGGQGSFVVHAYANFRNLSSHLQATDFLDMIGFHPFRGACPFFHSDCHWYSLGQTERSYHGMEHATQVVHESFRQFTAQVPTLIDHISKAYGIMRTIRGEVMAQSLPGPMDVSLDPSKMPPWTEDLKPAELKKLDAEIAERQKRARELRRVLSLVTATGDPLEDAVVAALQMLGLKAHKAQKAATVDVLAESDDGSKKFGVEVTGVTDAIKKDSKKIVQLVEFELHKEHGEKPALVANTFSTLPVSERDKNEHFSPQVIDVLTKQGALIMTGAELLRLVRDVLEGRRKQEDVVALLHTTVGRIKLG